MNQNVIRSFQQQIWKYYAQHKRIFPWRETYNPYHIVISEVMLQQTQTERVRAKYIEFLNQFPTIGELARASLLDVLGVWQGLGYNRRGMYLKKAAEIIVNDYDGVVPDAINELVKLPGIGVNTAGAICAFAYEKKVVFVETNIRRVFIHSFFTDQHNVHDKQIAETVEQTLPDTNFRDWYYALMDYGVFLSKTVANPNKQSRHYTVQSKFEGSRRQLRGAILRELLHRKIVTPEVFQDSRHDLEAVRTVFEHMKREGIICQVENGVTLSA